MSEVECANGFHIGNCPRCRDKQEAVKRFENQSRRERIATAALQGICASTDALGRRLPIEEMFILTAIRLADGLIAALDQSGGEK